MSSDNQKYFNYIENNKEGLLYEFLPEGVLSGKEYKCSNVHGGTPSKGGSFSLNIDTFVFASFSGDLPDLGIPKKGIWNLLKYQGNTDAEIFELLKDKVESATATQIKTPPKQSAPQSKSSSKGEYIPKDFINSKIISSLNDTCDYFEKERFKGYKCTKRYPYKDSKGNIVFVIARFEDGNGRKQMLPISYNNHGKGRIGAGGIKSDLILPMLLDKFYGASTIILVEGEKACNAGNKLIGQMKGMPVPYLFTTLPFGVAGFEGLKNASPEEQIKRLSYFKDKNIILWPDKDPASDIEKENRVGQKAMASFAKLLAKHNVTTEVSTVVTHTIDALKDKEDVADLLERDYFKDKFLVAWLKDNTVVSGKKVNEPIPLPPEPPRSVPVDEIMSASPNFMNEASMIPEDISSGDCMSILNLLNAPTSSGSMKLKEADESHIIFILDNHKKLGIKIYKDNFLQEEILEIKKKNGSIEKLPLADSRARNVIATLITRKGIKGIKKQDIASAIDAYRTDGIEEIDSLKDYIGMCVEKYPEKDIPFKATDFIERYLAGKGEWSKHESGIMAMSAMSAWLDDDTTNDIDFVLENSTNIGNNSNIGKSYAAKMLAPSPEMFSDSGGIDFTKKQSIGIQLKGKAVVEFSELDKLTIKEESAYKRFLGMDVIEFDIKFSMCQGKLTKRWLPLSTTNNAEYITDDTERRRVPIEVGVIKKSKHQISKDREMIYAAFYYYYQAQKAKGVTHNSMLGDDNPEYKKYYEIKVASKRGKDYWEEYVILWLLGWECVDALGHTVDRVIPPRQGFSINRLVEDMSALARSKSLSQKAFPDYSHMKHLVRRLGCSSDKSNNGYVIPERLLEKTERYLGKLESNTQS